jgi:cytokinin riboside 5'-monophosphate phosphoribohydrolase
MAPPVFEKKTICVYMSSSDAVAPEYFAAAETLGRLIGQGGHSLVYGGCCVGLMGAVAKAAKQHGGKVVGIIPESIHGRGLGYHEADELHVTESMHERKKMMEDRADAFIGLPGGFGTLEEMVQVINLKQLGYHTKPIVFINLNGFYDPLLDFFQHTIDRHFAKTEHQNLYQVVPTPDAVFPYLANYQPSELPPKWFAKQG